MLEHISCGILFFNKSDFRNEGDNSRTKDTVDYYVWMAKLADKGKISCIFFADTYGGE